MNYRFTDKEIDNIKKNTTIIVDTREQNNNHILSWFDKHKIKYIVKKLEFGDYSCMLPKGAFKGQDRDIYFDMDIAIERKACIDKLASNFKDDGVRIKTEMAHLNMHKIKFFVLVEDPNYDVNIRTGNYRSEYNPKSLYNRIKKGIELRYNTLIRPISKDVIGSEIYNTCEAYIYETLKTRGYCSEINWREEENIWEDEKFECN